MWNTIPFEKRMLTALKRDYGDEVGTKYYAQYISARDSLMDDNFFSQINGMEPNLSDHGTKHIANVLTNAEKLLGNEMGNISGLNLYCLGLVILFHDVGNIEGRENHNEKIAEVYNFVRKKEVRFNRERNLVIRAGKAHCGKGKNGSKDTLKDLDEIESLDGEQINLRDIAAILRLADELAEGPQRTSQFMIDNHKYDKESEIFHKYAGITQMHIDRELGRVSVTYDVDFEISKMDKESLTELLKFSYERVVKIDEERRYNKHYCNLLMPFKKTTVQYNFTINGIPHNLDLGKIEISDEFPVPGEKTSGFEKLLKLNTQLDIEEIWSQIDKTIKSV